MNLIFIDSLTIHFEDYYSWVKVEVKCLFEHIKVQYLLVVLNLDHDCELLPFDKKHMK